MTRPDIVKIIMRDVQYDEIVVASTGYISREVFRVMDRPLNFYMMGSMGNALAIGIGLAMHLTQKVSVINGDGSALMSLGTMVTAKKLYLTNLYHFILDNKCHESTGCQPTASDEIYFQSLCRNTFVSHIQTCDDVPPRIPLTPKQITERFKNAVSAFSDKQIKFA